MAMPASSAALITSSSRTEPPGWITAVAPAALRDPDAPEPLKRLRLTWAVLTGRL